MAFSPIELVVPPYFPYDTPALGASQLKANLSKAGYRANVHYFNVQVARLLGRSLYDLFCFTGDHHGRSPLLGDYLFSMATFEKTREAVEAYYEELIAPTRSAQLLTRLFPRLSPADLLSKLSETLSELTSNLLAAILSARPEIVGVSSSFQTNGAAIYIVKRVKALSPDTVTIMGGANCLGEMGEELLTRIPELDFVANGEADQTFVEFVRAVHERRTPRIHGINGRGTRVGGSSSAAARTPEPGTVLTTEEFRALPAPDFDEYFEVCRQLGLEQPKTVLYQAARGCWWGQKHPCTFCAVNLQGMAFRSKPPRQALDETRALLKRYRSNRLFLVDSILNIGYFGTFFTWLAEDPLAEFHFESTVNLTKEQVHILRRAGARNVNPGIESLSDNTLKLLRKPNSALHNLRALKWFSDVGTAVYWSILCGAPGETDASVRTKRRSSSRL